MVQIIGMFMVFVGGTGLLLLVGAALFVSVARAPGHAHRPTGEYPRLGYGSRPALPHASPQSVVVEQEASPAAIDEDLLEEVFAELLALRERIGEMADELRKVRARLDLSNPEDAVYGTQVKPAPPLTRSA
jgi:hypothetical protein